MKNLVWSVWALLIGCGLVGCDKKVWTAAAAQQAQLDSIAAMGAVRAMSAKKIVVNGPVTFTYQYGHDLTATSTATDNYKAGQKGGAAATAPHATATATTEKAGTPWWVYALPLVLGLVGGWLLRARAAAVPVLGQLLHAVPWL